MGIRVYCNKCDGYTNCRPPEYICCHCGAKLVEPADPPIAVVPAPRPENDGRENWRAMISSSLPKEGEKIDFANHQFVPCFKCSEATGSPSLCRGCLANRQTIAELNEIAALAQSVVRERKAKGVEAREARAVVSNYEVGNFSPLYDIGRCDERLSVDVLLDKIISLAQTVRHGSTTEIVQLANTYRAITKRVREAATNRGWYPP